jgi:ketosteroid isomerase-like protein
MGQQEDDHIAVVKRFYEYLANDDRDGAYANIIAEDCELHETSALPYGGVYSGRALMKQILAGVMARFDKFDCKILNYLAGGDEVVVHLHLSGVGRQSRKSFSVTALELWRIRDGKVVELRPFLFDAAVIADALS